MKEKLSNFWEKLKNPPLFVKVITFLTAIISCGGALCMLAVDYNGNALAILAYSLFAIAALSLSYAVYIIIKIIPTAKRDVTELLEKNAFTQRLIRNYGFRTVIFAIGSFTVSAAFGVFNGYMGISRKSIWYGALSAYYIFLAFLRGGILVYHKRKARKNNRAEVNEEIEKAKVYRNSGIILLILSTALSSAIAQMIFSDAHFSYFSWTIFAYAAYAFYKITMSIINLVKARRYPDLTVRAIRNVNLADATVSILALQTALLTTFSSEEVNVSLFNTLTGSVVSFFTIALGIYMIVSASKIIKESRKEDIKNER